MKTNQYNIKRSNIAKRFLLIGSMLLGLVACSGTSVPTNQPISHDLDEIPYQSKDAIIAMRSFDVPKGSTPVIQSGPFQLDDNIYKDNGHTKLIPRRSILEGVYYNDGTSCTVTWKNVFPSIVEYKKQRNDWDVVSASSDTLCDPKRGIKAGDRMVVKFNPN